MEVLPQTNGTGPMGIRRRAAFGLIATAMVLSPNVAWGADSPATPAPQSVVDVSGRVGLKGWGYANTTLGFRADLSGTVGGVGPVNVRLEEDIKTSTVLGVQNGKVRVRSTARYTFTANDGTFWGDTATILSVPLTITAAGPVVDSNNFIDLDISIVLLGGTGRYRNAKGTIPLQGILAEIPAENGRRRFVTEISGSAAITVEKNPSNAT